MKHFCCCIHILSSLIVFIFFCSVQIKAANDESRKKTQSSSGLIKVHYGNAHYMPLSEESSHHLALSRAIRLEQSTLQKRVNRIQSSSHQIHHPKASRVDEIQIKGNPHEKYEKQFDHSTSSPFKVNLKRQRDNHHQNVDEIMKKKFKSWKTDKEINEQKTDQILRKSFQGWKTNAEIKSQSITSTNSNIPQQQHQQHHQSSNENESDAKMKKYFSKLNSTTPSKKSN